MNFHSRKKVAVIGECMLEVSTASSAVCHSSMQATLGFGGDTLNFAVYLARLGNLVDYVTALGDDAKSDWMVAEWRSEGVGCEHVVRMPGRVPGLYMIEIDDRGERSFQYWRDRSPASQLFDDPDEAAKIFLALQEYPYLFISGISVAILQPEVRKRLIGYLADYRSGGGKVVFDGNYRANLWRSLQDVQESYESIYQCCDIALSTYEDEQSVFGYTTPEQAMHGILQQGVAEVVLKLGERGCLFQCEDEFGSVPTDSVSVVDTTSAGDSFNAGYIAARIAGNSVPDACRAGHELAGAVIQHRGAIIPRHLMPPLKF